jgi:hypothetical protein
VQDVVNAASLSFLLWEGCFSSFTIHFEVIINNKLAPTAPLQETASTIVTICYPLFIILAWFLVETNWTGKW